jgi:hypothetical protein
MQPSGVAASPGSLGQDYSLPRPRPTGPHPQGLGSWGGGGVQQVRQLRVPPAWVQAGYQKPPLPAQHGTSDAGASQPAPSEKA